MNEPNRVETDLARLSIIQAYTTPKARNILVAGTEKEEALWDNGGIFTQALVRGREAGGDARKWG